MCPVLAAASWWRLRALDRVVGVHDEDVRLLQRVPMLRTLRCPRSSSSLVASSPATYRPGRRCSSQGDLGDRYYVVESGEVDVVGDGRVVGHARPGRGIR